MTDSELRVKLKWDMLSPQKKDAWIAEKVMGWRREHSPDGGPTLGKTIWLIRGHSLPILLEDFNPSESISAAWEVVEKMRPMNPIAHAGPFSDFCRYLMRLARGNVEPPWDFEESVYDLMLHLSPEIICLAALLALEVQS